MVAPRSSWGLLLSLSPLLTDPKVDGEEGGAPSSIITIAISAVGIDDGAGVGTDEVNEVEEEEVEDEGSSGNGRFSGDPERDPDPPPRNCCCCC